MDSNDLEKERGITILSKSTTVSYTAEDGEEYQINIVDTPGHADFGGEVERVLKMVDSVLLLVDAFEGPMPQTRFVLRKSLALGLRPLVVINKIDRPDARPHEVLDEVFELFIALDATDEQLDFPTLYASGRDGFAMNEMEEEKQDLTPIFESIVKNVPAPPMDKDKPLCLQIATLDYDSFIGRIGVARIYEGTVKTNDDVTICSPDGSSRVARVTRLMRFDGLEKITVESASAGQIVMIAGLGDILPGDTVNSKGIEKALPAIEIDEPTISMNFTVNDSGFAGLEGEYVTSRQIWERLERELESDVSLRAEPGETPDTFKVSGRGELHIAILVERMRREGYELGVSRPRVILREDDEGRTLEPFEEVVIECGEDYSGAVINKLNQRRGQMKSMTPSGEGMTRLEYVVPSRGLIGFRNEFLTDTRGTGVMHANFDHYGEYTGSIEKRANGALIVQDDGETTTYALHSLQERGVLFVGPGEEVYKGQIIGQHSRDNDLVVNPCKKKGLTNVRAAGSDDKLVLAPPREMNLERGLQWINDDELVEVTPSAIRIRKALLDHNERKRAEKAKKKG
jgi:GTP-binding protein